LAKLKLATCPSHFIFTAHWAYQVPDADVSPSVHPLSIPLSYLKN